MKLYSNMLKIGIVGIGEHSWNNILPSLIQIPNILTISVCDIDENKANLAALKYNARAYYGYKQMIKHEKLDVIIIASHPKVHYEVAKMALKKDIAVFIEKPPTFNLKELKTLIKIKKQQTITGVGLNFNYAETINIVDELAKKENFGQIKYLSISHYSNKPKKPFWGIKSLVKSFLLSQAIHPIGFMLKYGNNIKSCNANVINIKDNLFINGNFFLENKYGNQIIANLTTGNMSPHFMWNLELITEKSIVIRINSLWELEIFDQNKNTNLIDNTKRWKDVWNPSPLSTGYSRTGYLNQFVNFFDCVKNKKQFTSNLESLIPIYNILNILEKKLLKKINF